MSTVKLIEREERPKWRSCHNADKTAFINLIILSLKCEVKCH